MLMYLNRSRKPGHPRKSSMQRIKESSPSWRVNSAMWRAEAPKNVPTSIITLGLTFCMRCSKTAPYEPHPLTLLPRRRGVTCAGGKLS
uniref:Uncharacterized protein n=1 Tax=Rhizophora mucronata TaxID=61149 RepID=A0A2P2MZ06_RHIMU